MADTNSTESKKDEVSNSPTVKALSRHFVKYPLSKETQSSEASPNITDTTSSKKTEIDTADCYVNEEKLLYFNKDAGFSIAY